MRSRKAASIHHSISHGGVASYRHRKSPNRIPQQNDGCNHSSGGAPAGRAVYFSSMADKKRRRLDSMS